MTLNNVAFKKISICNATWILALVFGLLSFSLSASDVTNTKGVAPYELVSNDDLAKETATLTSISPSGLKYMNGKIAVDRWMEALVREEQGESEAFTVFDAMHDDWKTQNAIYKDAFFARKLIKPLQGGFTHRGFTEDNLLVVDHTTNGEIVTRYYLKIAKTSDYGRIIPKYEVNNGKLYITPWQKAAVPF